MDETESNIQTEPATNRMGLWFLLLTGLLLTLVAIAIAWYSQFFAYELSSIESPILEMLVFFGIAFVVYLSSIFVAVHTAQQKATTLTIWGFAIGLRLLFLFSEPILEIDIYRYLWDGRVVITGVNPYQYSPQQVLDGDHNSPDNLQKLVALRKASPSLQTILSRVHYEELTTIYPPVSQVVFAFAQSITPQNASVTTHLNVMKGVILLFDLLTIFIIIKMLQLTSKHIGWVVTYAWSPLVLKEFANSGHLDAITVCLTTAAIYFLIKLCYRSSIIKNDIPSKSIIGVTLASLMLALAVGAKLYPVVLFPLMFITIWRHISLKSATLFSLIFFAVVVPVLWLMVPAEHIAKGTIAKNESSSVLQDVYEELVPPSLTGDAPPLTSAAVAHQQADAGLEEFLKTWQMNDLFFMIISENLTPSESDNSSYRWFTITSQQTRLDITQKVAPLLRITPEQVPFLLTRLITTLIFFVIVMFLTFPKQKTMTAENFLQAAFLTLAWFWLLLPTQNPWYWIWVMPLLPFVNNRAWLLLSGLVFVCYSRFWFEHHFDDLQLFGATFSGTHFYDYVVVWAEYLPWLLALLLYRPICYLRSK